MENYKGEVWIPNPDPLQDSIFFKGEIIDKDENNSNDFKIKLKNSQEVIDVNLNDIQKANPLNFDGIDDMASLTYLNEPSVLNNLKLRYQNDKIYTHSGLFLVTVNPYKKINIYNSDFIHLYSQKNPNDNDNNNNSTETKQSINDNIKLNPHIFGTAQKAYSNLIKEKKDQSILVTGESGAGKTENTKKVIQYILAVSTNPNDQDNAVILENQILQANPILESFGNATTVRNLNSSRFGKFIKIQINTSKNELSGAHIDWYLLEKSRVISQDSKERNYHIFYQLLKGATPELLDKLLITSINLKDYEYLKNGLTVPIDNVDDEQEFNNLLKAFKTMTFNDNTTLNIFKILAIILHLGNVKFKNAINDTKQAVLMDDSEPIVEKISKLLGVSSKDFKTSFLKSKVKMGMELVSQDRTAKQAKFSIDALAKSLYEKLFQYLVDRINQNFKTSTSLTNEFLESVDNYIGILDIAGFEIFEKNSFEQLCINYTNEKLQQFFNHHMFELEQSEYMKEGISWNYIDFGNELKPTIELIEGIAANRKKTSIFSILDDNCVVSTNTDKSFIDSLFEDLENKDSNIDKTKLPFKANKLRDGFIIKHYAGSVDYSIDGWINKNKDPLSSSMVQLLSNSENTLIQSFFDADSMDFNITDSPIKGSPRKKSGMFRTVAGRHKEQLGLLMDQLSKTYPHFVRCILPNNEKKAGVFNDRIVLHQLRCNGVLEGIRIARSGYPNRIDFRSFANHYNILSNIFFNISEKKSNSEYKQVCEIILSGLDLDPEVYKIGLTKLFFRNGVLASLEKRRDEKLSNIFTNFNSIVRGRLIRRNFQTKLQRFRASKILLKNFKLYFESNSDPWFKLIKGLKPRLDDAHIIEVNYTTKISKLENKIKELNSQLTTESSDRENYNHKLELLQEELTVNKESLSKKDIEIGESRKNIVELEKELFSLKESHTETATILKQKENELEKLSQINIKGIKELEVKNKELLEDKSKLQSELNAKTKSLSLLKDEIISLESKNGKQEMELSSLKLEKKTKDKVENQKLSELETKLNKALTENENYKTQLQNKTELLNNSISTLDDLKLETASNLNELVQLREIKKDYDAKHLALEQAEKIKKKYKQLKHDFAQTKLLLDKKVKDEIEFNEGRQQYNKELEETKSIVKGLQKELEVEKRTAVDLELKLQHSQLETERAIKEKKVLEIDNSQLKVRLNSANPKEVVMKQMEANDLNNKLSPEIHQLKEEIRILRTRVASESYENRCLKAIIKKGGDISSYLDNFKFSGMKNEYRNNVNDIQIFNEYTEADDLKEKLLVEKEVNKRLQNHYVQLQKDLIYYKSKFNNSRDSIDSKAFELLDSESIEYKSKFKMAEIELNDLKEIIKDLRLALKKKSGVVPLNESSLDRSFLHDATNTENNLNNKTNEIKLKHENLRLSSALNELKTKLNRLETGNGNRFEQEEEIIQLKNNLKATQLKNSALNSSIDLYKDRSEDYYAKLSKAEVELQSSYRERDKLKNNISHLKAKLDRSEYQFNEADNNVQILNSKLRELENKLADKDLELKQLTESYENLKDKYEDSEKLRKTVKSVNHTYQEAEINKLNEDLKKYVDKETEMSKLIKSLNYQLETCRKEIATAKNNNTEIMKEKNIISKALQDCSSKNESLLGEVETSILKIQNLSKQINILNVTNDNLLRERDDLLTSKRLLEDELSSIKIEFETHLARVRDDANNAVLVKQLNERLQKSAEEFNAKINISKEFEAKYKKVSNELEQLKDTYMRTIEENKQLVKYNISIKEKLEESQKKYLAEIKAQDLHWSQRVNELDEKLYLTKSTQRNETHRFESLNRTIKDLEIRNQDLQRSKKRSEEEIKQLDAAIEKMQASYDSLNKREMEAQLRCKQLSRECEKFRQIASLANK
jgi:myosin protein heavy chain